MKLSGTSHMLRSHEALDVKIYRYNNTKKECDLWFLHVFDSIFIRVLEDHDGVRGSCTTYIHT